MADKLKTLNSRGVEIFHNYLTNLDERASENPPYEILNRDDTSRDIDAIIELEKVSPDTSYEMACYLIDKLKSAEDIARRENVGLWSWLSLYYFDIVAPLKADGTRFVGREYRHIPDLYYTMIHRHLLSGPYTLISQHPVFGKFLVSTKPYNENEIYHQFCSRQNIISNSSLFEAAYILYCEKEKEKPKKKAARSKNEPGTIYRFITVIQQLEMTYDLFSMTAEQILSLLPEEFNEWKSSG